MASHVTTEVRITKTASSPTLAYPSSPILFMLFQNYLVLFMLFAHLPLVLHTGSLCQIVSAAWSAHAERGGTLLKCPPTLKTSCKQKISRENISSWGARNVLCVCF